MRNHRRAAIDRYLLAFRRSAANPPHAAAAICASWYLNVAKFSSVQEACGSRTKLELPVEFPVDEGLDVGAFVDANNNHRCQDACGADSAQRKLNSCGESHVYDLYAVCSHSGNLLSGHYTGGLSALVPRSSIIIIVIIIDILEWPKQ